jgi:hypothetical protein
MNYITIDINTSTAPSMTQTIFTDEMEMFNIICLMMQYSYHHKTFNIFTCSFPAMKQVHPSVLTASDSEMAQRASRATL